MSAPCPVCSKSIALAELEEHVDACLTGNSAGAVADSSSGDSVWFCGECTLENPASNLACDACGAARPARDGPAVTGKVADSDADFARRLLEEEQAALAPRTITCRLCSSPANLDDVFILDECSCKFCRECIKGYVIRRVKVDVTITCPVSECGKPLSVRDTNDLLPKVSKGDSMVPDGHTEKQATERIFQELKAINKSKPDAQGYSVKPVKDNLYLWEVRFFNFDASEPLAQDLAKRKDKEILLNMILPKSFPFEPPFIRVIRPRFVFRTGHVTIGGSICTEMLTKSGWSPTQSLEACIISVRTNLLTGGARLDTGKTADYSMEEARAAFDRMVREHGW